MADTKDPLEARRWFRRRLTELGTQYPHLKKPDQHDRLADELDRQAEEETPCHGHPPGTPEADPKAPAD
jgi:hypothetical protein